jgi:hypothetical protein
MVFLGGGEVDVFLTYLTALSNYKWMSLRVLRWFLSCDLERGPLRQHLCEEKKKTTGKGWTAASLPACCEHDAEVAGHARQEVVVVYFEELSHTSPLRWLVWSGLWRWDVNGTGLGPCPASDISIWSFESSDFATREVSLYSVTFSYRPVILLRITIS